GDATGKDRAVLRILQAGQGVLQVAVVGTATAGVVKAARVPRLVSRGHVDGRDHRAGLAAVILANMDGSGLKTCFARHRGVVFHGRSATQSRGSTGVQPHLSRAVSTSGRNTVSR